MSEKKNIDKLFKEQLKDFEVAPNDAIWENIERELHKDKRKRRVIPIWWNFAGVAAGLALLFTVGNIVFNGNTDTSLDPEVVTDTSDKASSDDATTTKNPSEVKTSETLNPNRIVDNKTSEDTTEDATNTVSKNQLTTSETSNKNNTVVTSSEDKRSVQQLKETSNIKNRSQQQDAVVTTNTTISKTNKDNTNVTSTQDNAVVNTSKNELNENDIKKKQSELDKLIKDNKNAKITQITSSKNSEKTKKENANSVLDSSRSNHIIKDVKNTNPIAVTSSKTSEKENATSVIDSSKINAIIKEENAIEKAIAEAEETVDSINETEKPLKRWSVAPNVAPVYFNTLGKGSTLDDQFINNTKEGDVKVSYGVKGSYAINKKLKIRAGINKVDLGYSTNNVLVFDGANASANTLQMRNVRLNDTLNGNAYLSANSVNFASGPEILFTKEQGSIDQQLGFIEVPIELEYNILDKKIGLNLIGGFSTLFLSNNEIYSVQNNGNKTLLGEATNINDMSYSANFGVGINYNISEKLRFNLEPMFKYQINTFSDTSGDFQPFFIGVYTGLSFKF